jgi:hypothetical protein
MRRVLLSVLMLTAAPVLAEEPGASGPATAAPSKEAEAGAAADPADVKEAEKVLTSYLDAVKKKKYKDALKFVHPKTHALLDGQKKKNKDSQNRMDPESWAKTDFWLKEYKVDANLARAAGTIQFTVKETNFRVQEKGEDSEPETDAYLLGKSGGKWLVVDKLNNNTFDNKTIKLSYKGYFDGEPAAAAPAEPKE